MTFRLRFRQLLRAFTVPTRRFDSLLKSMALGQMSGCSPYAHSLKTGSAQRWEPILYLIATNHTLLLTFNCRLSLPSDLPLLTIVWASAESEGLERAVLFCRYATFLNTLAGEVCIFNARRQLYLWVGIHKIVRDDHQCIHMDCNCLLMIVSSPPRNYGK